MGSQKACEYLIFSETHYIFLNPALVVFLIVQDFELQKKKEKNH